jgi:hypothetical protein
MSSWSRFWYEGGYSVRAAGRRQWQWIATARVVAAQLSAPGAGI